MSVISPVACDTQHTILPVSVDARAKMKIAFGQAPARPFSSSFLVLVPKPNWRAWISFSEN
jgi:hypothetical protein